MLYHQTTNDSLLVHKLLKLIVSIKWGKCHGTYENNGAMKQMSKWEQWSHGNNAMSWYQNTNGSLIVHGLLKLIISINS